VAAFCGLGPTGSVEVMTHQVGNHPKRDLTMFATIARFCVAHRRWVLAAWMLLLVIGLAAGAMTMSRLKDSGGSGSSESARGAAIVDKATSLGPAAWAWPSRSSLLAFAGGRGESYGE